jgi:tetratricopeptide (TPR) repeat protein
MLLRLRIHRADEEYLSMSVGVAHQQNGNLLEAIKCFEQLIKLDCKDLDGYMKLAASYHHSQRLHEAIEIYRKALTIESDHVGCLIKLAIIYQELATSTIQSSSAGVDDRLRYLSEALSAYERVLRLLNAGACIAVDSSLSTSVSVKDEIQAASKKLRSSIEFYQLADDQVVEAR